MKKSLKKLSKVKLFLIVFGLLVLLTFIIKPSYARYIYNGLKDYYYESQSFYFNCDKLSSNNAVFQLDNWDGVNTFNVTYNMNSIKNDLVASSGDIYYDIEYECSSNATCTISKEEGLIDSTSHTDFFTVSITPNTVLGQGDTVTLTVSASSTVPYEKTISGIVRLNVGVPGISYEIVDKGGQPYLDFKITNTLNYYQVVTAFGNYSVGDRIEEEVYNNLSSTDKEKCTSALIKLTFNPNIILVDVTSDFYDNA